MILLQQILGGLLIGAVYSLFAVGLSLSLGVMRVLNVAHGAVLTLSVVLALEVSRSVSWLNNMPAIVILGMAFGGLGVLLTDFFAFRPARLADKLSPSQAERATLVGSLAFLFAYDAIALQRTNAQPVSLPSDVFSSVPVHIGSISVSSAPLIGAIVAVVIFASMALIVRKTQVGRGLRATTQDREAAQYLGVNVERYAQVSSLVAGMLAGLAGVFIVASLGAVDYSSGDNLMHRGFVIVVLGGIGSIEGSLVGGLLLGVVEVLTGYYVGSSWQAAVPMILFMVLVVFRPNGLFGSMNVRRI